MTALSNYKLLLACVVLIILTSCATILNRPFQRVTISHDNKTQIIAVVKADSAIIKKVNGDEYWIERSKAPVYLTLRSDGAVRQIVLPAESSFAYYFNIPENFGVGMLIDRNNPKRFGMQRYNYFTLKNDAVLATGYGAIQPGTAFFDISPLASVNIFNVKSGFGRYKSGGPLTFAMGVDFFYKTDKYFSARFGAATDRFAEHIGKGYYQTNSVAYINAEDHFVKGKFDFGYGISLSKYIWNNVTLGDTIKNDLVKRNTTAGLSLSLNYRVAKRWFIEGLYEPGIFIFGKSPEWVYQHYLSLGCVYKLKL